MATARVPYKEPQYKIDLRKVFDRAYSGDNNRRLRTILKPLLSEKSFQRLYGRRVIDRIFERTTQSIDKNGKPFPKYTEAYKESLAFRAFGKTSKVNLRLTGDMLTDMNAKAKTTQMVIFLRSEENKKKAHGHISGNVRKDGKKRDFLGLPKDEEEKIMIETFRDTVGNQSLAAAELFDFATQFAAFENLGL